MIESQVTAEFEDNGKDKLPKISNLQKNWQVLRGKSNVL